MSFYTPLVSKKTPSYSSNGLFLYHVPHQLNHLVRLFSAGTTVAAWIWEKMATRKPFVLLSEEKPMSPLFCSR